jgi:hypothetical protein
MRDVDPLALVFRQAFVLGERILQGAKHQGKRCAKFVADIGEKCRLGAVDFGQSFQSRPRPLEVVGSYNGGGNLSRQQFHKAAVVGVGGAVRIETRDKKSERRTALSRHDRRDQRLGRRLLPMIEAKVRDGFPWDAHERGAGRTDIQWPQ